LQAGSTHFIGHAIAAFGINPFDIVGWTSKPTGATFNAIFKSNRGDFLFLIPFVHICGTKKGAIFGRTLDTRIVLFDRQMRHLITLKPDRKQFIRNRLTHPFIALQPL
jgi:hypothetical protein